MKAYVVLGLVLLLIAAAVGGYIRSQAANLAAQARTIQEQGKAVGALTTANAAQAAVITELRDGKKRDNSLVADTAQKIETLSTRIQGLDRRTQEALRNAKDLTLDSLLPADAADALCLQWHAAGGLSGDSAADHPGDAAGGAAARAGHPSAAGPGNSGPAGPDCRAWRKLTVRDAVEWNGLLLRHAGLEREDKAALRQWAVEVER